MFFNHPLRIRWFNFSTNSIISVFPPAAMTEQPDRQNKATWTRLSQHELERVLQIHERFLAGQSSGRRALLKFHDLNGLDVRQRDLRQADLSGAALHATSLFRANLSGSSLANSIGPGVNLDYADLARADFTGARITPQLIARGKLEATIMPDGTVHA